MNTLIKVTEQNGQQLVSARELYEFLEIKRDFTNWCKQMFEYGFEEHKDFTPILAKTSTAKGGRPSVDYALTLDCSKEISMLARIEKGEQIRNYFLEVERKFKEVFSVPQSFSDALMLAASQQNNSRILYS
jgi:anti-repressor protein